MSKREGEGKQNKQKKHLSFTDLIQGWSLQIAIQFVELLKALTMNIHLQLIANQNQNKKKASLIRRANKINKNNYLTLMNMKC